MPRFRLTTQAKHPMLGNLLNERYQIIQVLSAGRLGRKYIAQDTLLPGQPKCTIKHLQPASKDPSFLQAVRRLFISEVNVLRELGEHDQIPQVLGYFENDKGFYWVEEFIEGHTLSSLLPTSIRCGKRWTEDQVTQLLQEILGILEFIHARGIVHCHVHPNNIVKRAIDGKLFLIDFDSVEPIEMRSLDDDDDSDEFDLVPAGYIPAEQLLAQPRPNSDIYALGMIGIQALTGLHPAQLQDDSEPINWQQMVSVSEGFATILNQMVQYDCKDRYQTATEVLQTIDQLFVKSLESEVVEASLVSDLVIIPDLFLSNAEDLEDVLDLTPDLVVTSLPEVSPEGQPDNIPDSSSQNDPRLVPTTSQPKQPTIPRRKLSPAWGTFSIVMAGNALFLTAGLVYMLQPDPSRFQFVEQLIDEKQMLAGAKAVCQIPRICFWEKNKAVIAKKGKPLTEPEVHQLMQQAYTLAQKGNFSAALVYLKKITPGSPKYNYVQAKISEYTKVVGIREATGQVADMKRNR